MTIRHQIEFEALYFFALAALIGGTLALSSHHQPKPISFLLPVVEDIKNPVQSLEPTPKETLSQLSPDGTKKITMTVITDKNGSKTYTFVTTSEDGTSTPIYTTTLPQGESMTIPFNTWSPDNKYIFLEHSTPSETVALAMRADGQPINDTEKAYNITDIFTARGTQYTYQETTGWASETLLIVNTTQSDGSKGASFWVELPSKAVIQLSTQF